MTGKALRQIRINPDNNPSRSKVFSQNNNQQSLFGNTQTFGQPPGAQQQQPGTPQQPGLQQPGLQQQQPGLQQQGLQPPGLQQPGLQQQQPGLQQQGLQPLSPSQQQ